MRALLNMPIHKIFKGVPVNLAIPKRRDKGNDGTMKARHQNSPAAGGRKGTARFANALILPIFSAISIVFLHIIFVVAPGPGHSPDAAEIATSEDILPGLESLDLNDAQIATYKSPSVFLENQTRITLSSAEEQRLVKAIEDIDNNNWVSAQTSVSDMQSAFGRRLFNWLWLVKYDDDVPFYEATRFLDTITNWPEHYRIRRKIERSLDSQNFKNPHDLTKWFDDNPPLTTEGMRFYLHYLKQTGQTSTAEEVFNAYWADTLLRPQEQKYFYRHYGDWLEQSSHEKRLDRLLHARQYTNARNLADVMGVSYEKLVEARIALAENKSGVDWYIRQVPGELQSNPGLIYERLKWRREKNLHLRAIEILNAPPSLDTVSNSSEWWLERHIMARRLIEIKDFDGAYSLVANHRQKEGFAYAQAEWLSGWLALNFLNKPVRAFEHFQNLYNNVETPISRSRGAYWSGKAQHDLKQYVQAAKWYEIARRHGATFYGQLAASTLKSLEPYLDADTLHSVNHSQVMKETVSYALNFPQPPITFEAQLAFNQHELVMAAKLLNKAGMREEAGEFLEALGRTAQSPMDYRLASDLAKTLGQTHKSLNIAKKASYTGSVLTDHQFPVAYELTRDIDDVEHALIFGIMRQESAFNTQAQSHAGARGLMQLMPATAAALARKYRKQHSTQWLTQRPDHNVKLGSIYLRDLLKRYDNSYVLAIAAYNAGPGRVSDWLEENGDPRDGDISWINWIELIPIYETRNYVQRVLEAVYVYRSILQQNETIHIQHNQSLPLNPHNASYRASGN